MKTLLALSLMIASSVAAVAADAPSFFKKGDQLSIQYAASVQAGTPTEVVVQDFGPGSWLLVEYDRTSGTRGESGLKTEKAKTWINFAHVVTARVVSGK